MAQFFLEAFQWHGVKRGDAFAFYAGDIRVEGPHPFCSSGGNLGNGRTRTAMYTDSIERLRGTAGARRVRVRAETALAAFTTPSSGGSGGTFTDICLFEEQSAASRFGSSRPDLLIPPRRSQRELPKRSSRSPLWIRPRLQSRPAPAPAAVIVSLSTRYASANRTSKTLAQRDPDQHQWRTKQKQAGWLGRRGRAGWCEGDVC